MIPRTITAHLQALFRQYPFVTLTGPRQSGKTTLCRAAFPELAYVNLESPRSRRFAEEDPERFLAGYPQGAVLDEVQRVPELLSWLQALGDERRENGLFVLTGSGQFLLFNKVDQSLAGRTALLRLLPLSIEELTAAGRTPELDEMLFAGFFPRIHDQALDPTTALGDYVETYLERDVRRIGEIRNLTAFRRFVRLCAGRVGQLLDYSALGADAGVTHSTARGWLSLLEASYILFRLEPFHANVRKRLIRSPKLYFYDVGLASWLLDIENPGQLRTHPLRGALFENAVVVEAMKHTYNTGRRPRVSFFRDRRGQECDLLYQSGDRLLALEAKSGATVASDWFAGLRRIADIVPGITGRAVVYGGAAHERRRVDEAIPLTGLPELLKRFDAGN